MTTTHVRPSLNCPTTHIKNTSTHSDRVIFDLITIALTSQEFPIDMSTVAIHVKEYNPRGVARTRIGAAYRRVPHSSPWVTVSGVSNLIMACTMTNRKYPVDNRIWTPRVQTLLKSYSREEYLIQRLAMLGSLDPKIWLETKTHVNVVRINGLARYEYRLVRRFDDLVPYGGNRSPLVVTNTWQEAFIGTVAHEMQHVVQFRNKLPVREYQCEQAKQKALDYYRSLDNAGHAAIAASVTRNN